MVENGLNSDTPTGVSAAEVTQRLRQHGYNELHSTQSRSLLATAWEVAREPMFLMLLACGAIYLVLGDVQEALMLLGFVFVVMGITLYQEQNTERALEALKIFPVRAIWGFVMTTESERLAEKSYRMILSYWPKVIGFPQIL